MSEWQPIETAPLPYPKETEVTETLTPDAAFDADIPEAMRDEIMTAISEAAHMGTGTHGCVHILEHDRIDAINVRAEGIFTAEGKEYWFLIEDGNRDLLLTSRTS